MKFLSWSISLGSGTSGGTLAPLLTIGAGLGHVLGAAAIFCLPQAGIDLRLAALVGMAATFSGASRALLTSAVFAFETTCQPNGLLPLLAGCAASYLVASLAGKNSIMTEKIARRGIRAPADYVPDPLEQVTISEIASNPVVTLHADDTVAATRAWLVSDVEASRHQGFPIVDARGIVIGVLTRRDLQAASAADSQKLRELVMRTLKFVYDDCTARQAADHMVNHNIGRLPVVLRRDPTRLSGIVTRSDILSAYRDRIEQDQAQRPVLRVSQLSKRLRRRPTPRFSEKV
jgi:CIC family chloride channel protein